MPHGGLSQSNNERESFAQHVTLCLVSLVVALFLPSPCLEVDDALGFSLDTSTVSSLEFSS